MPLQQQVIPLPFAAGVNKKVDALQLEPPFLSVAQNCTFTSPGKLQKRNGYGAVSNVVAGGGTIDAGYALANYRDELLAFDANNAYSYAADADQWIDKGNVVSTVVTRTPVDVATSFVDFEFDSATHPDGLQCYVWTRARSFDAAAERDVWLTVLDTTTGQIIRTAAVVAETAQRARVVVRRNSFIVYIYDYTTTTIKVASFGVTTPLATLSFTSITSTGATASAINSTRPYFDVIVADSTSGGGNSIYLTFNNRTGGNGVTLWHFADGGGTPSTALTSPTNEANQSGIEGRVCTVFFDPFESGPCVAYANGSEIYLMRYSGDLGQQFSNDWIDSQTNIRAITGVCLSETSLDVRLFYSNSVANSPVWSASITGDYYLSVMGMVTTVLFSYAVQYSGRALLYSVKLASKAWGRDGVPFVSVTHNSALQPTYFSVNGDTGSVVMRALRGTGFFATVGTVAAIAQGQNLPAVSLVGTDSYRFAAGEILGLPPDAGDIASVFTAVDVDNVTPVGVTALTIDFNDSQRSYQSAEIGGNLHLGGGSPSIYDGQSFVEDGFHLYPEGITVSGLSAGSTTSYQYVAVYEWTDNQNNLWRSAPSVAVTTTSSAAISGGNSASVVVPTLRLTDKTPANGRGNVMIALYRTENGQSTFYRLPFTSTNINDTTTNSVTLTDSTTDADLVDGVRLYTDGSPGPVENVPPPPSGAIVAHRNRLFVLDSTHPLTIWYSKEVEPGIPAEFGEGFVINVSPNGGPVTALASMDDKLVIFKESQIYAMTGEGPDTSGANDDYAAPVFVTGDCGCTNQRSVVFMPEGLMFQSAKGIKLLTRALELVDIGAPVQGIDTGDVTSAVLMPDVDQVRMTLNDGTALAFDYFVKQWAQFTQIAAVDSRIWNDLHVYLRSAGTVLKETPGVYTDNGSYIPMKVTTAWLKVAGLQGFQRLWRFLILGTYESAHDLRVQVAHDFNPNPTQDVLISPSSVGTFGSDATFGASDFFGGEFPLYQWQVNMTRQASQAVQITIQDVRTDETGQSMSLSGITLLVGTKQGTNKLGASRLYGA